MMRLFLISKVLAVLIILYGLILTGEAHAQLSAVEDSALSFGTFSFVSMYDPVVITVDTANNVSSNSNVVVLSAPQRGEYTLTGGTPNAAFSITTPPSVTISNGPSGEFTIDDFTISPSTSSFDGFGEARITVGARLQSSGGGTQYANGTYPGTLTITVSY